MKIHQQIETNSKGTEWVIKNQDDVTICRSPKRYKNRNAALKALELFMSTMRPGGEVTKNEQTVESVG